MTTLRVLIIPEQTALADGSFVTMYTAIGLEHYLVGQGSTMGAACAALDRAVVSTMLAMTECGKPATLAGIKPAPADLQEMYDHKDVQRLPSEEHRLVGLAALDFVTQPALVRGAA